MTRDGASVEAVWRGLTTRARRAGMRAGELARVLVGGAGARWRERGARRRAGERPPRRARPVEGGTPVLVQPDDDIATVLGRIDAAERAEVVLVVPRRAGAMRQIGAWAHVAAYARQRGVSVSVLAARGEVRAYAASSGLRTARTARGLRVRDRPGVELGGARVPLPVLGLRRLVQLVMLFALASTVAVVGCYVLPSAEVVLVPVTSEVVERETVRVNPLLLEVDVELGVVPGATLSETVTTIVSTVTTGTAQIGEARATVELRFDNAGATPTEVEAGTIVRDEAGVEFALDEAVVVPPADVATVGATALEAGSAGNLEAGALFVLTGLADTLTVTNPAAASGGTDVEVQAVVQEDVDRVASIARPVLERLGLRQLEEQVAGGRVFPQTVDVSIFSQTPLQQLGEPAEAFLMEYTAIVTVLAVTERSARAFGEELVAGRLDEGRALLPGAVDVEIEGPGALEGGQLTVELVATGQVADRVDAAAWGDRLTGMSPGTAAEHLDAELALLEPPRISLRPGWLPWIWLPRRGERISIRLETPSLGVPAEEGPDEETATATPVAWRVGTAR